MALPATTAEVDGERLADEEIVGFAGLLLLAGHVTTTALLGNAVLCFDRYREAAAAVRADRDLLPAAIEEVLRFRSPFPRLVRVTTTDTEIGGRTVSAASWWPCGSRPPTGTSCGSPSPIGSTSTAPAPATWPSGMASTSASARRWPAGGQDRPGHPAASATGTSRWTLLADRVPQPVADDFGEAAPGVCRQITSEKCTLPTQLLRCRLG
jgi:hypothetical protein